jgi:hypothetical protein
MIRKIERALKKSIAHWGRMAAGEQKSGEVPSWLHCALCDLFIGERCVGCPVFNITGKTYCKGTPYIKASAIFFDKGERFSPSFKQMAKKEHEFLTKLLPKKQTNKQTR